MIQEVILSGLIGFSIGIFVGALATVYKLKKLETKEKNNDTL